LHTHLGRAGTAAAALVVAALLITGCSNADDWSEPHPKPSAIGTVEAGFTPDGPPTPEATITPEPGSWDDVRPSKDYRVVLLTTDQDEQTRTMAKAVRSWAEDQDASLKTVKAADPTRYLAAIDKARKLKPDLVVATGSDLVDPLATVTAHFLDQKFLVLGAELAEPTANVTAADWDGASFRGEGLGMSSTYDPTTFTPERAARAIRAGVAAVLSGLSGSVVWLD
jgi:basic membrane lipoprotein Med (substrate-binding protein (PBP1-ABC) superfamily)